MAPTGSPRSAYPSALTDVTGPDGRDPVVVWVRGEHDLCTEVALAETLDRAMALDDGDVVVDLSAVSFMGAGTVEIFVRLREQLGRSSRSLVLRAPSKIARRVIDLCGCIDLIGPEPAAAITTGSAQALSTWVAVPVAVRDDGVVVGAPGAPGSPGSPGDPHTGVSNVEPVPSTRTPTPLAQVVIPSPSLVRATLPVGERSTIATDRGGS